MANEVSKDPTIGIRHNCALRDMDDDVVSIGARAVRTLARFAVASLAVGRAMNLQQAAGAVIDHEDHVAAATAIAAVWASEWLELLAMNGCAAMPAVTSGRVDDRAVNKCGHVWIPSSPFGEICASSGRSHRMVRISGAKWCPGTTKPRGWSPEGIQHGVARMSVLADLNDVDDLAATTGAEVDGPGSQCEQGVVAATADVLAWVEVCSTLPDDDFAGVD